MSITIATVRIMLSAFQASSIAGIVDAVILSIPHSTLTVVYGCCFGRAVVFR